MHHSRSGDGSSQRGGDESQNASQAEDEDEEGNDFGLGSRSRTMSGGTQKNFDLTSPMKHESSRVGDDFQAAIPPLSLNGSMELEASTPASTPSKSKAAVDEGSTTRSTFLG